MASTYPKVRSACENCHRRKIRCILPVANGACQNCTASRTPCLFAPRAKAGRPRRAGTESRQAEQQLWRDVPESPSYLSTEGPHDEPAQGLIDVTLLEKERRDVAADAAAAIALEDCWVLGDFNVTPDLIAQPAATEIDGRLMLARHYESSSRPVAQQSALGVLTPPTTASTNPFERLDSVGAADAAFDFEERLSLCADLNRHCHLLRESRCDFDDIHTVLASVDSTCTQAMKADGPSRPGSDRALAALTLAALHKFFELCDVLVRRAESESSIQEAQTLEHMLVLKRLDLVLLQANICLARLGQHDATKTATRIHQRIESLVQHLYRSLDVTG